MPRTLLLVSATAADAERLRTNGPRRDFLEAAAATGGEILYQESNGSRRGWRAKLFGPHVRQAWRAAGRVEPGDIVFADGEHNGIPLLVSLALRRRRPERVVMLGHLLTRRWKLAMLALATRLGPGGVLAVHSVEQATAARRWLGRRWRIQLLPYQVDTDYWRRTEPAPAADPPLVVAVGSENRDYDTLVRAVDGLPLRVVIAAGSHWARSVAGTATLPTNVDYRSDPLPFAELRELYARAALVVVPVHDVANQSGVTVILEAMSMGLPVVVTASRGQRECITGPLVHGDGALDPAATANRGPHLFGDHASRDTTGFYVPPGDPAALRSAIEWLIAHPALAAPYGEAGRRAACRHFGIERYTAWFARELSVQTPGPAAPERFVAEPR
ncbi:MAG: glycosyltransferase family 4 protein [Hyphomicrobiales bacterium]